MAASEKEEAFDGRFASQLEQLEYYSHDDHVEVKVAEVKWDGDDKVWVQFDPPLGEPFEREMDVPYDPNETTEFTQLLDETGRNFSSAEEIVGDRIPATYTEQGWEIQYSEPDRTTREKLEATLSRESLTYASYVALAVGAFIYWPATGLAISAAAVGHEPDDDDTEPIPPIGGAIIYGMGLLIWLAASGMVKVAANLAGFQFPVEVVVQL